MSSVTYTRVEDFQPPHEKKKSHASRVGSANDTPQPPSNANAIDLAYLMIFHANQIEQHTVQISAKMIESNASAQEFINDLQDHIEFFTLSQSAFVNKKGKAKKVDSTVLTDLQIKNNQIMARREALTNGLNLLRQAASINTAQANTETDVCQQNVSEASDIMQILEALTNQINRS